MEAVRPKGESTMVWVRGGPTGADAVYKVEVPRMWGADASNGRPDGPD